MISMAEIQEMARDAYERGKRDGAAEERERIEHIIQSRILAIKPPDDGKPSVLQTIRVELQRVLADIRSAEEADDVS